MKKAALIPTIGFAMFLVACGDDKDTATNVPEDAPQEQNTGTTTDTNTNTTDQRFAFTHFKLNVDYAGNKSFDVDYENESNGAEAKIEDDLNNNIVQGNNAIDELVPIFEKFSFDAATADDKVIEEVLNAFNLATDYQEFELEVRFADGVEKEIKRMP